MERLIEAVGLSLGFTLLFVTFIYYLGNRTGSLRNGLLIQLVLLMSAVSSVVPAAGREGSGYSGFLVRSLLFADIGFALYGLFLLLQKCFRLHLPTVKRWAFGFLVFFTPQLVFSSSVAMGAGGAGHAVRIVLSVFSTAAAGAACTALFVTPGRPFRGKVLLAAGFAAVLLCNAAKLVRPGITGSPFPAGGYIVFCVIGLFLAALHAGPVLHFRSSGDAVSSNFSAYGVSGRELEIIELVVQGLSNREIGDRLFISLSTVKTHLYNIYRKLGVRSRVELVLIAGKR